MTDSTQEAKIIAKFMDLDYVVIGFYGTDDETVFQRENRKWLNKPKIIRQYDNSVGEYYVNVEKDIIIPVEDIDYKSWKDLMPVVEKINRTKIKKERIDVIIYRNTCHINDPRQILIEGTGKDMMEATYKAVVEFIKWLKREH